MAKLGVLGAVVALACVSAVAAAEPQLTMSADHRVVPFGGPLTLSGSLATGRADEEISVEAKDCGVPGWRLVRNERSEAGGNWHTGVAPAVSTSYRARWRNALTPAVEVLVRPAVRFEQEGANRFSVLTIAVRFFRGAKGRVERFDRSRGRWVLVRRVTLSRRSAPRGATWAYSGAEFTARVRRGTLVRFVLPRDQAGACYLAGHSIQFNVK